MASHYSNTWPTPNDKYKVIADESGLDNNGDGTAYYGYALPGTATSAAKWKIYRSVKGTGVTTVTIANGGAGNADYGFNQVWDNRASLTYS